MIPKICGCLFLIVTGCIGRFSLEPEKRKELPSGTDNHPPIIVVAKPAGSAPNAGRVPEKERPGSFNLNEYRNRQLMFAEKMTQYLFIGACVRFPDNAQLKLCEDYYYSISEQPQEKLTFIGELKKGCTALNGSVWQKETCVPSGVMPELVCYEQLEGKRLKLSLRMSTFLDYEDAKFGLRDASEIVAARCKN